MVYRYTLFSFFFFFEKEEDLLGRMWNVGLRAEPSSGKVRSGRAEGQLYQRTVFLRTILYRVFGETWVKISD